MYHSKLQDDRNDQRKVIGKISVEIFIMCVFLHAIMMDMSSLFQFKLNNYCKNYSHCDKCT